MGRSPYVNYQKGKISVKKFVDSYHADYDSALHNLRWSVVVSRKDGNIPIEEPKKNDLIKGYKHLIKKVNSIRLMSQKDKKNNLLEKLKTDLKVLLGNYPGEFNYFFIKTMEKGFP